MVGDVIAAKFIWTVFCLIVSSNPNKKPKGRQSNQRKMDGKKCELVNRQID